MSNRDMEAVEFSFDIRCASRDPAAHAAETRPHAMPAARPESNGKCLSSNRHTRSAEIPWLRRRQMVKKFLGTARGNALPSSSRVWDDSQKRE